MLADTAPTDASEPALEEVVVTAQKRSERLLDVPLSVTAASGDQLARQGITSPTDLERVVPGFSYQQSSSGVPVFTIRGVGVYDTFALGMSPAVTVYVDQAPLPFLAMTAGATLDLDRLEVLKGPQVHSCSVRNSTGGALNYIAAKPTDHLESGVDLTYGRFNERDAEAFVSGPLLETVTARLAVREEARGGWQISDSRPGDSLGKRNFQTGRLLLDWKPSTDGLRFELNINGWKDRSDTQAMQFRQFAAARPLNGNPPGYPESFLAIGSLAPAPQNDRAADWDADPFRPLTHDDRFYQLALRGEMDLPLGLALTSISAYSDYSAFDTTDEDGTNFNNFLSSIDAGIHSFSQELRLAGPIGDRGTFTLGGNYQHDDVNDDDVAHYTGTNSGVGPFRYTNFGNLADQNVRTEAVFGALDYKLIRARSPRSRPARVTPRRTGDFLRLPAGWQATAEASPERIGFLPSGCRGYSVRARRAGVLRDHGRRFCNTASDRFQESRREQCVLACGVELEARSRPVGVWKRHEGLQGRVIHPAAGIVRRATHSSDTGVGARLRGRHQSVLRCRQSRSPPPFITTITVISRFSVLRRFRSSGRCRRCRIFPR